MSIENDLVLNKNGDITLIKGIDFIHNAMTLSFKKLCNIEYNKIRQIMAEIDVDGTEWLDNEKTPQIDFNFDNSDIEFDVPKFAPFKNTKPDSTNKIASFYTNCYFCDKRPEFVLASGHMICNRCKKEHVDQ